MTTAVRTRRMIALSMTFAVLVAGLTLASPSQPAEAVTNASMSASILKQVNANRVSFGQGKLRSHPAIAALAQAWAQKKANSGTSGTVSQPAATLPADGAYHYVPDVTARQAVGAFDPKFPTLGSVSMTLSVGLLDDHQFNYGAVGWALRGNKAYGVLVLMYYPLCAELTLVSSVAKILGTGGVGSTLNASSTIWSKNTQFSYLWSIDGEPLSDQKTYVPTPEQRGKRITLDMTGYQYCYTSVTRSVSKAITPGVLTKRTPVVVGDRNVGETLTATAGQWLPAETEYAFQWLRNGAVIPSATGDSYQLAAADRGKRIDARVTGSAVGYAPSSIASATTLLVDHPLLTAMPVPVITGDPTFGQTLTVDAGAWEPAPVTLAYQWRVGGAAVAGATKSTFILPASSVGKLVTVTVTGSRVDFATKARASVPTTAVASTPFASAPAPSIAGVAKKGATLTATASGWPAGTVVGYQWLLNDVPIKKAVNRTLVPATGFSAGGLITVRITANKPGFTTTQVTSAPVVFG